MLSFKSLACFATLAFGALSAMAVPVLNHDNVVANAIVARCDTCSSVPVIMDDLSVAVAVSVQTLRKSQDFCSFIVLYLRLF